MSSQDGMCLEKTLSPMSINVYSFAENPKDFKFEPTNTNLDSSNLYSFARTHHFMLILQRLCYGTNLDFIKDVMDDCLLNNIISEEATHDPIWTEHKIEIIDTDKIEKHILPSILEYSDDNDLSNKHKGKEKVYWDINLKKVNLPIGWTIKRGCSCGHNINQSSFMLINDKNELIKDLCFFNKIDTNTNPLNLFMDLLSF
jgi:hypothetical protein